MTKPYPAWVCSDCGTKLGKWSASGRYTGPKGHCATMHYDTCDVCGKHDVPCTEPRDYGHLIDDWDLVTKKITTQTPDTVQKAPRQTHPRSQAGPRCS